MHITPRSIPAHHVTELEHAGVHPLLARLFAARGIRSADDLDIALNRLLPPTMRGLPEAARLLADAIAHDKRLCIVADYDCDGATACAVGVRGLRLLGARHVSYLVPDRIHDGYGLTPTIADRVAEQGADVLITVDNGIASIEGIDHARALGMQTLVTDHHLPADGGILPAADALVNPNQPHCPFPSKSIAGVGVMFYVLMALRSELRARGLFDASNQPKLDTLLPLVALGTVADVVKLDANNRRLVAQGLKRVRALAMPAGIASLFAASGRDARVASAFDFGFALGPRINAAGRLADMTLGIECLVTDDPRRADELAHTLDSINRERRSIEGTMREQALQVVESLFDVEGGEAPPPAICVFDPDFHEGVVGIVASRIKDDLHRPVFVFAQGKGDELKGSGRSIPGFHLRDALDLIAKRHPHVILRFGGHAMAAGCTIDADSLDIFEQAFIEIAEKNLTPDILQRELQTDGALPPEYRSVETVDMLHQEVWGQGFPPPLFSEEVEVLSQRVLKDKHLKLQVKHQGEAIDAIWFNHTEPLPQRATVAYQLSINEWNGARKVQMMVEGVKE